MKVICIYEVDHGVIGIAKNYESAIKFLVEKECWINMYEVTDEGYTMYEKFGVNWLESIYYLGIKKFNDVFFNRYFLREMEVYQG